MAAHFLLPKNREEIRLFGAGMAFHLALTEYIKEEPKTIEELQKAAEYAYGVLEQSATRVGKTLSNDDASAKALLLEAFFWGYHHCTRMLNEEGSKWANLVNHVKNTKTEVALDIIFTQLRADWEILSATLPRKDDEYTCAYSGCHDPIVAIVRTITLKNEQGRPFTFKLGGCNAHLDALAAQLRDNGKLQVLLEEMAPEIFLTKKILAARKEKLLIDRFRIAQRWDESSAEYRGMQQQFGERGVQFSFAFVDAYVDIAKKYELTPSAGAFVLSLPPIPFYRAIAEAVDFAERVFITFEEPIESPYGACSGYSFGVKSLENLLYANRIVPHSKGQLEKMRAIMLQENSTTVGIDAFAESGLAIWTLSLELPRTIVPGAPLQPIYFMTQSWQQCTSGECGDGKPVCAACTAINAWYYSLYSNILRLIAGDYAMEEESSGQFPIKSRTSKRRQPDKEKYWKIRDVEVTYEYHVVSMDALLKKSSVEALPIKQHRGSWLEKLDPEHIVYVRKRISLKKGRTLKDPRYHKYILAHGGNPEEGYTIAVKDHEKRIPMKLETLTKLIERVEVKGPTFLKRE